VTTQIDVAALFRLWAHLPRVFRRTNLFSHSYDGSYDIAEPCAAADATIVTSEVRSTALHAPVLDVDMPCALVPSSTPGHFHLFIERGLTWHQYRRLLKALGRAGILEPDYVRASLQRRYSAVRVPWVKK
jgi:hypothetical protein